MGILYITGSKKKTWEKPFLWLHMLAICFLLCGNMTLHANPVFSWAKAIGNSSSSRANDIVTDAAGNVYITGLFNGTVDFDPGTGISELTPVSFVDAFIAKYDASGNYLWAHSIGGDAPSSMNIGYGIAVDTAGNVYATGFYEGTADFDPSAGTDNLISNGGDDIFIVKYDENGNYIWAKNMGGANSDYGQAIALDTAGNVLITGHFKGNVDFDPSTSGQNFLFTTGDHDIFVAKYDKAGNYLWAKGIGGTGDNGAEGHGIVADTAGNVYATGYFQGTANFGTVTLAAPIVGGYSQAEIFIAKWDESGNLIWAKSMGGKKIDISSGIALDKANNLYITGWYMGAALDSIDFDPSTTGASFLTSSGGTDVFIAKYDKGGNYIWAKGIGGGSSDYGYAVDVNAIGDVIVSGSFNGTVDFNPGGSNTVNLQASDDDIFIAQYAANGDYKWVGRVGSTGLYHSDYGYGVDVGADGSIYATGLYYSNSSDFDPGPGTEVLDGAGIYTLKLSCGDTSSSYVDATSSCGGYVIDGTIYSETGIYTIVIPNTIGCDSTITLNLSIELPKAMINVNGFVLGTTQSFATYQWMKDGTIILGATDATYTVSVNADYQVIVTNNSGCIDTSDIYTVTNTSIGDIKFLASQISTYPNPSHDMVYIQSPVSINVALCSIEGRIIREIENTRSLSLKNLADGVYLLRITDREGAFIKTEKLIKQQQ